MYSMCPLSLKMITSEGFCVGLYQRGTTFIAVSGPVSITHHHHCTPSRQAVEAVLHSDLSRAEVLA